jgi:hypothetical protein
LPKEAAHKATWALRNSSVLVDPMCSNFAEGCKIKGTMQLRIASRRTVGGSVLLAAELSKPVADKHSQYDAPISVALAGLQRTAS